MELDVTRKKIDAIDDKLIDLFIKRMNLSRDIAEYKKENGLPVLNSKREADILRRISEKTGPAINPYAEKFFNNLFDLSRAQQKAQLFRYGLVGENLSHSYSKIIHDKISDDYSYTLFSLNANEFKNFIKSGDFDGLNITIPYKKAVMPFCDEISDIAAEIGAVNTVYKKNGKLYGTNTDYAGFLFMLDRSGISLKNKRVLILGGGGASLTVQKCARDRGASAITVAGRNHDFSNDRGAEIIVNATPVGMFPENGAKIIDLSDFPRCKGVIDVVYNPLNTDLLLRAKEMGILYTNGLPMLVAQATSAAGLFTGKDYTDKNEEILDALTVSVQNIVLIGMPGAGKTTIGKKLACMLGKDFIDLDASVTEKAGMPIPDVFEKYGEKRFRDMESEAAKEYGRQRNLVIATGGGCVLRKENMDALIQNGVVIFLDRPLKFLETKGRPLSKSPEALRWMYKYRLPFYEKYGDYRVVIKSSDI